MEIILAVISFCVIALVSLVFIPVDEIIHAKRQHKIYSKINAKQHTEVTYSGQFERYFLKLAQGCSFSFRTKISANKYKKMDSDLIASGLDKKLDVETYMGLKLLCAIIVFIVYLCICAAYGFQVYAVFLVLIATMVGYVIPDYMVASKIKARKDKINRELPGILNTLAVMTDAGLSLYEALKKVSESRRGIVPLELRQVVEDVDLGTGLRESLMRCTKRCNSDQFDSFVLSICQGLEKGNQGIAAELKRISSETWEIRKDRAIELGSKASTKLLFPMIVFCFPALFILILGPAFLSIIKIL